LHRQRRRSVRLRCYCSRNEHCEPAEDGLHDAISDVSGLLGQHGTGRGRPFFGHLRSMLMSVVASTIRPCRQFCMQHNSTVFNSNRGSRYESPEGKQYCALRLTSSHYFVLSDTSSMTGYIPVCH